MMKFKRGSKVEVFNKKEYPCGSWRSGEILSGNGHSYDVRFDSVLGDPILERVSRKYIRPLPPLFHTCKDWVPGDIAEVFHAMSWKLAKVSQVTGGDYYLVILLGSSQEVRAHISQIRVRQIWIRKAGEWLMVGKALGLCQKEKSELRCYKKSRCVVGAAGGKRNVREDARCVFGRSLEVSDAESTASSVGSCSINSRLHYDVPLCLLTNPRYDSDNHSSDAESFCGWEYAPFPKRVTWERKLIC